MIIDTGVGLHASDVTRKNYNNNAIRLTLNYETTSVSMFTIICRRHYHPVLNSNINDLVWLISVSFAMTIHSSRQAQTDAKSPKFQTRNTIHNQTHATAQLRMLCLHVFVSSKIATAGDGVHFLRPGW